MCRLLGKDVQMQYQNRESKTRWGELNSNNIEFRHLMICGIFFNSNRLITASALKCMCIEKNLEIIWKNSSRVLSNTGIFLQLNFSMHMHFKVHINSVGILINFNLWILLRKIVEYLVGQTFHLPGLSRCRWHSYRKWRQCRHAIGRKQCLQQGNIRLFIISSISTITKINKIIYQNLK